MSFKKLALRVTLYYPGSGLVLRVRERAETSKHDGRRYHFFHTSFKV